MQFKKKRIANNNLDKYFYKYKIFTKEISSELSNKKKNKEKQVFLFLFFHLFGIDTFTDDLVPASFIIRPENKFSEQETHK